MRPRLATAAAAARRNAPRIAIAGVAASAFVVSGTGTAVAAGWVDSGDIKNNAVHRGHLNGPTMGDINHVGKGEIPDDQVGKMELNKYAMGDINNVHSGEIPAGTVRWHDIKKGTIGPYRLTDSLRARIDEPVVPGYDPVTKTATVQWGTDQPQLIKVTCPDGKFALGGGYHITGTGDKGKFPVEAEVYSSYARPGFGSEVTNEWHVRVANPGAYDAKVKVSVHCGAVK